jgi:NADH:ubiquinone oxidoreductase subunit F (NADH-binding)
MNAARLLAGLSHGPLDLEAHLGVHGDAPVLPGPVLAQEIHRVALRGRGGGGFPLARKLEAIGRASGAPILVVNGCEGDPLSGKDRLLLTATPHLVIDGAVALARAVGAREIRLAIDVGRPEVDVTLQRALAERPERIPASVMRLPGGYVSGQETALVRVTRDGIAAPLAVPPRVSRRGIDRRPTLVANAETVAQVALLARLGAPAFAAIGTSEQPGTALVTLSGAVARPGVHEIAYGTSLSALLAAGGGVTDVPAAVLIGGCAGTWIAAERAARLRLSDRELQALGAGGLGLGVIVVLGRDDCPTAEVARAARWMADRSAGQCGPCVHGLSAIADALSAVRSGHAGPDALRDVDRWARMSVGRGACAHPDGTARFVSSALRVFADDLADHQRHGPCGACDRPSALALPSPASAR